MKKLISIGIVLILFILAGYVILRRPEQVKRSQNTPTVSEETTLTKLAKALDVQPEIREYQYMDWIDKSTALPIMGKQFLMGTTNINGIARYKAIKENDLLSINQKNLTPLLTAADTFFTDQQFTISPENTRTVTTDGQIVVFKGYEKGKEKCVIRIDIETDPFGNFTCGEIDTTQHKLQEPFLPTFFGPAAKDKDMRSFRVQKVENNFALGSANGTFTGYMWIAKRNPTANPEWSVIWTGNEAPSCTDMKAREVPKTIYQTCY